MRWGKFILLGVAVLGTAAIAESYLGSGHYSINGVKYAVPHEYEFARNFSLPWLAGLNGLDKEPDQSIWLLFPAKQLAQGAPGYSQWFHGYSSAVEADLVVNVLGGKEAREFSGDRLEDMAKVAKELSNNAWSKPDPLPGWDRVYWLVGEKGTPAEGNNLFYLIPHSGVEHLPSDWRVPYCQSAPDSQGRETYDCSLTIYREGLSFGFYIRQENLSVANKIPDYVLSRLNAWRVQ